MRIEKAKCIAAIGKAILVEAPDLNAPVWVPQSQVDEDSEVHKVGTEGDLVVSDWWAGKQKWK